MPRKAFEIKFGSWYQCSSMLVVHNQPQLTGRSTIGYIDCNDPFIVLAFAKCDRWEKYGRLHRCIKVLTTDSVVGYVFVRLTSLILVRGTTKQR